jgi:hypothetical protein
MCRTGGRRCPASGGQGAKRDGPPADGKTRIEVVTSKRSYSVIGGESKVAWVPGEKVVSIDAINPGQPDSKAVRAGGNAPSDDDRAYLERVAEIDRREAVGESITDIMRQERNARLGRQIAQMTRESEQAAAEEARGW